MSQSTVKETHDERVVRLARQAQVKGVKVFQELSTGAWFATSASRPGQAHYVTAVSCSCEGFVFSGACSHNAALLDRLGWLPRVTEELPATVACSVCRGSGELWAEGSWSPDTCFVCRGIGRVEVIDRIGPVADNIVEFPRSDRPRPAA